MLHEFRMYSDALVLADVTSLVSFACNNPCPICPTTSAPACIEEVNAAYIGKWDFAEPIYGNTVADQGPHGMDFVLLDDQTSYDPIYVDNQGFYFDGTSTVRTTNTFTQSYEKSLTFEGWIRPSKSVLSGTLFAFENAPGSNDASLSLSDKALVVNLGGVKTSIPISYAAGDVDNWHYFGVSLKKIDSTTTRV
jgi:hypothetical protein